MSISLGNNINSLKAGRYLDRNTDSLSATHERLSSGMRINRASDDAAGLAISAGLNSSARLFTKALANVNDGISMLSVAEGALDELGRVFLRLEELATQAANGSYSALQRKALSNEADELRLEHNRILATTQYNGIRLLKNGASVTLQVGAEGSHFAELSSIRGLGDLVAEPPEYSISGGGGVTSSLVSTSVTETTMSLWLKSASANQYSLLFYNGYSGANGYGILLSNGGSGLGNELNVLLGGRSWDAVNSSTTLPVGEWSHLALTRSGSTWRLYLNGAEKHTGTLNPGTPGTATTQIGGWGALPFQGAVTDARFYNRALSGEEIKALHGGDDPHSGGLILSVPFVEGSGAVAADVSGSGNNVALTSTSWSKDLPSALKKNCIVLTTQAEARDSLPRIQAHREEVATLRGAIGAQVSRLRSTASVLTVGRENYKAAESRILDNDVAADAAELTRMSIGQKMTAAVMAQANVQPEIVLKLLRA